MKIKHDVTAALEAVICEVEKRAKVEAVEPISVSMLSARSLIRGDGISSATSVATESRRWRVGSTKSRPFADILARTYQHGAAGRTEGITKRVMLGSRHWSAT